MTHGLRLLAYIIAAALLIGVFFYITDAERAKRDLGDAENNIDTRERIDDATVPVDGCGWFDRLRASCPDQ